MLANIVLLSFLLMRAAPLTCRTDRTLLVKQNLCPILPCCSLGVKYSAIILGKRISTSFSETEFVPWQECVSS